MSNVCDPTTEKELQLKVENNEAMAQFTPLKQPVNIRIKLFNMIAKERGIDILSEGCFVKAAALLNFSQYRERVADRIIYAVSGTEKLNTCQLCDFLESQTDIHLFIIKQ